MTAHVSARSRRAAGTRSAVAISLVAALAGHALLAGAADATGFLSGWSFAADDPRADEKTAAAAKPRARLQPSCDGDALLAAGARSLLCASPLYASGRTCLTEVANRLESDRIRCHLDDLDAALVTITPIDVDKIPPITPEMLLDEPLEPTPPPEPPPPELITAAPQQQQPPPPPPPPPEPTPPARQLPEQIVETVEPSAAEPPPETRLLSEFNTRVDKQTVARGAVDEPMAARPQPAELKVAREPREDPGSTEPPDVEGQRADAPRTPGPLSMRAPGPKKPSEVAQEARTAGPLEGDDGPRGDGSRIARGDSLFTAEARERAVSPGEGGGGGGTTTRPDLRASKNVLERVAGGGSVDHLEDVEAGDETKLNSRESVYAVFFNRMKRSVGQRWRPQEVWGRRDPTLSESGMSDRFTGLRVSLSPSGEIVQIIVVEPSGLGFLDDEAIRAFRAAQPFPNPPQALVNAAGVITFNFGFHLDMRGVRTTEWKIFR